MEETEILKHAENVLRSGVKRIVTTLCPTDISEVPADSTFKPDIHMHREIMAVVAGDSEFMINSRMYHALPGTVFLLNSWEQHSWGYRKNDSQLLHLWIHFTPNVFNATLIQVDPGGRFYMIGRPVTFERDLCSLITRRWHDLELIGTAAFEQKEYFLRAPLECLLQEFTILEFESALRENAAKDNNITGFIENYIRSTNGKGCSLDNLERICGYSKFHISHIFHADTGKTVGEYIDSVRMQFAAEAKRRGYKQKEIAAELGFSSPATFWNWLNKQKGRP